MDAGEFKTLLNLPKSALHGACVYAVGKAITGLSRSCALATQSMRA
jgi:hypothetical protein